jgi:hypothetical protein
MRVGPAGSGRLDGEHGAARQVSKGENGAQKETCGMSNNGKSGRACVFGIRGCRLALLRAQACHDLAELLADRGLLEEADRALQVTIATRNGANPRLRAKWLSHYAKLCKMRGRLTDGLEACGCIFELGLTVGDSGIVESSCVHRTSHERSWVGAPVRRSGHIHHQHLDLHRGLERAGVTRNATHEAQVMLLGDLNAVPELLGGAVGARRAEDAGRVGQVRAAGTP